MSYKKKKFNWLETASGAIVIIGIIVIFVEVNSWDWVNRVGFFSVGPYLILHGGVGSLGGYLNMPYYKYNEYRLLQRGKKARIIGAALLMTGAFVMIVSYLGRTVS